MLDFVFQQLEAKESKLSSSMNSIKTFWSPELKKERALRKDEATKMAVWKEQYRVVQEETQVGKWCVRLCVLVYVSVCFCVAKSNTVIHCLYPWTVLAHCSAEEQIKTWTEQYVNFNILFRLQLFPPSFQLILDL